ncbi:hypothetical protein F4780DRAFT_128694 [Xylariomycetidae sp. FL0641]|nr:hypothetical protein F4780DRAFT_128694 [Xylariomycetidae sp. FL0641]
MMCPRPFEENIASSLQSRVTIDKDTHRKRKVKTPNARHQMNNATAVRASGPLSGIKGLSRPFRIRRFCASWLARRPGLPTVHSLSRCGTSPRCDFKTQSDVVNAYIVTDKQGPPMRGRHIQFYIATLVTIASDTDPKKHRGTKEELTFTTLHRLAHLRGDKVNNAGYLLKTKRRDKSYQGKKKEIEDSLTLLESGGVALRVTVRWIR